MKATRAKYGEAVRVRFPEPVLERLRLRAATADRTLSAEIRRAVREHLERAETDREPRPPELDWK